MNRRLLLLAIALPTPAWADGPNTGTDQEVVNVNMQVPPLCVLGDLDGGTETIFNFRVMSDRQTGLLRRDLTADDKRLVSSFCNSPSTIRVEASPMLLSGAASRALPSGFARRIHYVATASGWTDQPATFRTSGTATQATARRDQPRPRESDILLTLSEFQTEGGSDQRPLSGSYAGSITVTLGPRS